MMLPDDGTLIPCVAYHTPSSLHPASTSCAVGTSIAVLAHTTRYTGVRSAHQRLAHRQRSCVRLAIEDARCLEFRTDGQGLPTYRHAGIALHSMHEHVDALSGRFTLTSDSGVVNVT